MRVYRYFSVLLVALVLAIVPMVWAAAQLPVVTYGADLTSAQRDEMSRIFGLAGAKSDSFTRLEVTNEEERQYLKGIAPEEVIGTRAISSSRVELLPVGSGIKVETYNITWVTREMIASVLTTAKVKDARVIAAAPFAVSGTAALTGIFKGFERATGKKLSETDKRVANEELVKTGELGEQIGNKEKATQLILQVKERIIREKVTDPQEIKNIIINVAGDLNINLTPQQIEDIQALMERISKLELSINDIRTQLKTIEGRITNLVGEQREVQSLLARIMDFLERIWAEIQNLFSR